MRKFINALKDRGLLIAIYEDDKVVSAGDDYSIKIRDIETGDLILDIKNAHDNIITKVLVFENYLIFNFIPTREIIVIDDKRATNQAIIDTHHVRTIK